MPVSAIEVISPAFQHTKRHLLGPFRFGQWLRLAVVGFLAGEMGGGGGGFRFLSNIPGSIPSRTDQLQFQIPGLGGRSALFILGISLLLVLGLILGIIFLYISSRMRFVLFESIVNREVRIREFWRRHPTPAFRYFIFQVVFAFAGISTMAILFGVPLLLAFRAGVFRDPGEHIPLLAIGALILFVLFVGWFLVFALGTVLTKDFVVPQMALENLTAVEGWSRLFAMMKAEKGGFAGYIGMKILLALAAAIVLGIIGFIVVIVLLIPVGGVSILAILGGRAAGLTWNPVTIAIAIVVGLIVLVAIILLTSLINTPAIVFFPAYSVYFFADRYAPLRNRMYPPLIVTDG